MTDTPQDRRRERRRHDGHGIVAARVRPGLSVDVVNVSSSGVLIETTRPLLPGTCVELCFETEARPVSVRGSVLRCSVSRVRPAVCYRGAIGLDERLPWLSNDQTGYGVHGEDVRSGLPSRAPTTPRLR